MREHSLANPRFLGYKYRDIFNSTKTFFTFFAYLLRKIRKKMLKNRKKPCGLSIFRVQEV